MSGTVDVCILDRSTGLPIGTAGNPFPSTVTGGAASGAAAAGNPVLVAGVFDNAYPTLVTGNAGSLRLNSQGAQWTAPAASYVPSDGQANASGFGGMFTQSGFGLPIGTAGLMFNGTSWDRVRNNVDTAALVSHVAASAGVNGADQVNYNGRGIKIVVDITAMTGTTPMLTVTLQGKDAASGKYYTILVSTALAAVATTTLEVYPGIATAANVTAGVTLPRTWRVITTIAGTTPAITATVGASVIV